MTQRRSSVLSVPLSGHGSNSNNRSSISGGGLGAIRAEIVREPAALLHPVHSITSIEEEGTTTPKSQGTEDQSPKAVHRRRMSSVSSAPKPGTIPSIKEEEEEEDETPELYETQSPRAVNKRHPSSISSALPPEFHTPSFKIPTFRMPGFETPGTSSNEIAPHPLHPSTTTPDSKGHGRKQSIAFTLPQHTRSISPTRQVTRETEISATHKRQKSIVRVRQKSSILPAYIKEAQESVQKRTRQKWMAFAFRYTYYIICVLAVYFSLIGLPLWKGVVYWS